jgi:hypothetical protein
MTDMIQAGMSVVPAMRIDFGDIGWDHGRGDAVDSG